MQTLLKTGKAVVRYIEVQPDEVCRFGVPDGLSDKVDMHKYLNSRVEVKPSGIRGSGCGVFLKKGCKVKKGKRSLL